MKKEKYLAGWISVDSGLCMIGDPCYHLHKDPIDKPQSLGRTWLEFCDELKDMTNGSQEFSHNGGIEGMAIVTSTGWGDGCYPVYVTKVNGRVMKVEIEFTT